jgi:ATP-dependent RNA helicase DeaD
LKNVERATGQKIAPMSLPTAEKLNAARAASLGTKVSEALQQTAAEEYRQIVAQILATNDGLTAEDAAAAFAVLLNNGRPLLLRDLPSEALPKSTERQTLGRIRQGSAAGNHRAESRRIETPRRDQSLRRTGPRRKQEDENMESFRVQVGAMHGLKPSNLVGAIANEADLNSKYIGRIEIFDKHSTVDLPAGMPSEIFQLLSKVRVCNRPLNIQRLG